LPIVVGVGDVFKALADATRRAILDELTDRDATTILDFNDDSGGTLDPQTALGYVRTRVDTSNVTVVSQ
jgi:DNA-binding transcriptional ArsR family regulator